MISNYKRIGDFISEVDERNKDLQISLLLGVSIEKKFIPSIANIIGTDLSNYKIIRKNQFAYGPVTLRNGDKVSIALLEEKEAIISVAYTVFKIEKANELLPEYLNLLFQNPEYDRYARYNSWGLAREIFSWTDFCDTKLYIPNIEEQKKIIRQDNIIKNRISLLRNINIKLETELKLLLEKEITNITKTQNLNLFCEKIYSGGTPETAKPEYWNGDLRWLSSGETRNTFIIDTDRKITLQGVSNSSTKLAPENSLVIAIAGQGSTRGQVSYVINETYINQSVIVFQP